MTSKEYYPCPKCGGSGLIIEYCYKGPYQISTYPPVSTASTASNIIIKTCDECSRGST